MREVAGGVFHIDCLPLPNALNAFLVGDVLVDAGGRGHARRILEALRGRTVAAHALTHAHPDHQGGSHEICTKLGIPYWAPENDADAAEDPRLIAESQPRNPLAQGFVKLMLGPGHSVDRRLREGDEVAGFRVIEAPGHSRGHVVLWREDDRVLIAGDVLASRHPVLGLPGLRLPPDYLTPDPEANRRSAKRLGPLEPRVVLFGHGGPLRDTRKFVEFCARL